MVTRDTHLTQPGGQGEGEHRGGGDAGVGQGHQGGSLPGRGPHREQVIQRGEGETTGQTLQQETGQSSDNLIPCSFKV